MASVKRDYLRTVRFQPYRKGMGPVFQLRTWDTGRSYPTGQHILGYELRQCAWTEQVPGYGTNMHGYMHRPASVLFTGEDFGCAPSDAIDSDGAVRGVMGFLTLRPGDTDSDYFEGYSKEQFAFCTHHAEALSLEVTNRFGED